MAIGTESHSMASGRIVVIAVGEGLLGAISLLVGIGPQLQESDVATRLVGGLALLLGAVLLTGGFALSLRLRHARTLGMMAAASAIMVGAMVAVAATGSFGECPADRSGEFACQALVGGFAVLGAAISVLGTAAAVVLRRARPAAFRRHRRR